MRRSLIAGALATFGIAIAATIAVPAVREPNGGLFPRNNWPPDPDQIVNIQGEQFVASGQKVVVYTVPSDRWLIVTEVFTDSDGNESRMGSAFDLVQEDSTGNDTTKLALRFLRTLLSASAPERLSTAVGLKFAPGTSVVLKNAPGASGQTLGWNLIGYLARP